MRIAEPAARDFDAWVRRLSDRLRAPGAFRHLVSAGDGARAAIVRGLVSHSPDTRMHCARLLDHLVDESAYPSLIALLDDDDSRVRVEAIHALACDRCKADTCRPIAADVLPKAVELLRHDDDRHVRARAVELVGRFVHSHQEAEQALLAAATADPAPAVRKRAGWYAPGGTIFTKTLPRHRRAVAMVE